MDGLGSRYGHDGLELGGGQSVEAGLLSAAMLGAFGPGHDRDPESVVTSVPAASVEDLLLEQDDEGFHDGAGLPGMS